MSLLPVSDIDRKKQGGTHFARGQRGPRAGPAHATIIPFHSAAEIQGRVGNCRLSGRALGGGEAGHGSSITLQTFQAAIIFGWNLKQNVSVRNPPYEVPTRSLHVPCCSASCFSRSIRTWTPRGVDCRPTWGLGPGLLRSAHRKVDGGGRRRQQAARGAQNGRGEEELEAAEPRAQRKQEPQEGQDHET